MREGCRYNRGMDGDDLRLWSDSEPPEVHYFVVRDFDRSIFYQSARVLEVVDGEFIFLPEIAEQGGPME